MNCTASVTEKLIILEEVEEKKPRIRILRNRKYDERKKEGRKERGSDRERGIII